MERTFAFKALNYYKVLQIDPEADPEVVAAAYRRLARKYHPDLNHDARAKQRMLEINRAFEVLSDPAQRAAYDRTLRRPAPVAAAPTPARAREERIKRVLGAPIAAGLPAELDLGLVPPGKPVRREIALRNAGGGFLAGVFTSHAPWLTVTPASFQSNALTVELTADPRRLAEGHTYHARLDLAYDGILASCHVRMTIAAPHWRRWALVIALAAAGLLLAIVALVALFLFS